MTLSSILALLAMIPLAKSKTSKSSGIERVAELQARVDELERELDAVRRAWREAETWRQQAVAQQPLQVHQITEDMRQRMVLQSQAQAQRAQALAQHAQDMTGVPAFYGQGLGQLGVFGNAQNDWLYCNCVPGRGGFLRGDN